MLTPVIVRPDDEGGYEMISGHRRLFAAKKVGLLVIPATIKEMTDDDAVIAMVDSNIQREEILPSEKAFAYRMRYEAMRRKTGRPSKNSSQIETNLRADEALAEQVGESRAQVQRFIRLTEVIPELLDLIDRGNIAVMTGVDISHLDEKIQNWLYEYIKDNGVIKSYQISALRDDMNVGLSVYSLGAGIFYLLLFACVLLAVVSGQWMSAGILVGIILGMFVLTALVGITGAVLEVWKTKIKFFLMA